MRCARSRFHDATADMLRRAINGESLALAESDEEGKEESNDPASRGTAVGRALPNHAPR